MNAMIRRTIAAPMPFVKIQSELGRAFVQQATKEMASFVFPKRRSSDALKTVSRRNSACTTLTRTSTAVNVLLDMKPTLMALAKI